ncbi:50S ribosomal protein L25/general stress protein Ctc, partial [gut metagenome]
INEEEAPAVKLDKNLISHTVSYVEVTCLPKELPEFIQVDLSGLTTGSTFHASMLTLPEGVTVHSKTGEDIVLASVIAKVEEEIAGDEEEATETPAAAE